MRTLLVSEIYGPVIQGEGPVVGVPTVFVRLGGCDYRCEWCDSLYAVLPKYKNEWIKMTPKEIISTVDHLSKGAPVLVTLSGGNPALQNCLDLIDEGKRRGYTFAIETQGTKSDVQWWRLLEWVVLSPKPPSSKMKTDWDQLSTCIRVAQTAKNWAMKVVVFDDEDYEYATKVRDEFHPENFYLQAGTNSPYRDTSSFETLSMFREDILKKTDWLSRKVIEDRWYGARVLPQLHALAYGSKRGI